MKVIWQPKAMKQLKKIGDKSVQERLLGAAKSLSSFPDCQNVKRLTSHRYDFRLRAGNWRILFDALETVKAISIEEVKKRDERTY
ncbi:hypothetical protein MNBD_GAMMA18-1343 [hydrothermal vent metagenome]|uniref:Cytotoxic translational repressor of toxin-antitoxin stability system n=1 Tax=hydrothermal vent metagenome TaxID=652676 RepID=A0A3B0ZSS1_9ZZZZ